MTDVAAPSVMTAVESEAWRDRMRSLHQRFLDRTRTDATTLRALRARRDGGEPLSGALLADMLHMVHGLSGAAGIFGFDALSEAAHGLECRLRGLDGADDDPTPAFDRLEEALRLVLAGEAGAPPGAT